MKTSTALIAIAALTIANSVLAGNIYRCEVDGHTTFSQTPCPGADTTERVEVDIAPIGTSGLREGERRMLEGAEARDSAALERRNSAYDRDARYNLQPSERRKIQSLERERRALNDRLGSASVGDGIAIQAQIRAIDNEISRLRAPKW
jgi:hypothetical protein